MNLPKPVLIIDPEDWTEQIELDAIDAGYFPICGNVTQSTHILPDPNLYKADQRAHFAGLALQGLLAGGTSLSGKLTSIQVTPSLVEEASSVALTLADALISQLNKEKP